MVPCSHFHLDGISVQYPTTLSDLECSIDSPLSVRLYYAVQNCSYIYYSSFSGEEQVCCYHWKNLPIVSEQFSIAALNVIYKMLHYIFQVRIKNFSISKLHVKMNNILVPNQQSSCFLVDYI